MTISRGYSTLLRYDWSVSARVKRSLENRALARVPLGSRPGARRTFTPKIRADTGGIIGRGLITAAIGKPVLFSVPLGVAPPS